MPRTKYKRVGTLYEKTTEPTLWEKFCDVVGGVFIVLIVFVVLGAIFGG